MVKLVNILMSSHRNSCNYNNTSVVAVGRGVEKSRGRLLWDRGNLWLRVGEESGAVGDKMADRDP